MFLKCITRSVWALNLKARVANPTKKFWTSLSKFFKGELQAQV